jgi:hypothetical protein
LVLADWEITMKPVLSMLTLLVDDLERSLVFYRDGLGLPTKGIVGTQFEHGAVVFIELQGGVKLALWPRRSLVHDAGIASERGGSPQVTIGHLVDSAAEVDALVAQAERAGAVVVKRPGPAFWGGHSAYFRDPDGHLWEIAFNPEAAPA